jgi:hypothetical protein
LSQRMRIFGGRLEENDTTLAKKFKCVQRHLQTSLFPQLALGVTKVSRGVRAAGAKPRYWCCGLLEVMVGYDDFRSVFRCFLAS